jgi:transcriptional regulator with XRE-family HTH domain
MITYRQNGRMYKGSIPEISIVKVFGEILRELRLEKRLTQEQLGHAAGLQRKHISSLELGEKQPSISTMFRLADALSMSPSKMMSLVEAQLKT